MAVTEQLILDLSRAQQQIRGLENELDSLLQPVSIPVELDASGDIAELRRQVSNIDANVDVDVTGLQSVDEAADDAGRLSREFAEARAHAARVADQAERVKTELREANTASAGFGSRVRDIATVFAGLTAARSAFNFLSAGVQDAAALAESLNRVNVLFGDFAGDVVDFSETSSAALVLTQREALDAAGTFGGLANTVGLTQEASVEFATTLTDLSADLASFGDTSVEDAILAVGSALRGESEPIRRYNVLLNESTITAKALELGLAGANGEISEGAKVQARYAVILEQTAAAQGDLVATQDSLGNRLKSTRVDFLELRQELGEAVVPALEELLDVLPEVAEFFGSLGPAVGAAASELGNVVAPVGDLAFILNDIKGPLEDIAGLFGEAGEEAGFLVEAGDGIAQSFRDSLNPIAPVLREIARASRAAFPDTVENPLVEGFRELQDLGVRGLGDVSTGLEDVRIQTVLSADAVVAMVDGYRQLQSIGSDGIGDAGTAAEQAAAQLLGFKDTLDQLEVAGNVFAPLQSELDAISQAFEDTFAPDKNGDVFANIDELIADINQQFADAAEFESGLAELASRGFDDVAATFRERGPETIGLLREALADPSAASALESTLDAVGTAAGQGYAEGFAIGFNAESAALALEIADSVDNASVQQGIIAGALEMALLFAANFHPQILIDNFDISLPANVIRANIGGSPFGGSPSSPSGGTSSVGSSAQFQVNIINPTTTDLSTSAGQAAQTISAVSGLVQ